MAWNDETFSFEPDNWGSPGNSYYSGGGASAASGGGLNFSGLGDTVLGLASIFGAVEKAKVQSQTPAFQIGPDGRMYREGVPVSGYAASGLGGISPLMLLIIGGVVLFAMND